MIRAGANVVNMSFGTGSHSCGAPVAGSVSGNVTYGAGGYSNDGNDPFCALLRFASDMDVQIVGASGNKSSTAMQFPASDPRAVAVGGVQLGDTFGSLSNLEIWNAKQWKYESPARANIEVDEIGSNFGANQWLVAPARDIVSTFHPGAVWNPIIRCGSGTQFGPDPTFNWRNASGGVQTTAPGLPSTFNVGQAYGICSGTSMSAPFVSGILGATRSAIPLMNAKSYQPQNALGTWRSIDMRTLLKNSARIPDGTGFNYPVGTFLQQWGYGVPQGSFITSQLSTYSKGAPEDLTFESPMSEQESSDGNDFFYTTSPTQASGARWGGLLWPRTSSAQTYCGSRFAARTVDSYRNPAGGLGLVPPYFMVTGGNGQVNPPPPPTSCNQSGPERMRASFRVRTTPTGEDGSALLAINRYSVVVLQADGSYVVRHIYVARSPSAATNEFAQYNWKFDGIEGYIYPPWATPNRSDVEQLWLMFNPTTTTYALVLNSALFGWQARGFNIDATGSPCAGCAMGWVPKIY